MSDHTAVEPHKGTKLVLVTGPSGAGRTTAINALEDIGYEVIDNLPLTLLPRLLDGPAPNRPLALGLDVRNRDFSTDALLSTINGLAKQEDWALQVLYLDAAEEELLRRYSDTRRRHPLSPDGAPMAGIRQERALLAPLRDLADVLIDTSGLSPHEAKAEIGRWFDPGAGAHLAITLQSFSYKRGLPRGLDIVMDCRFLRNPHWDETLRAADGRDHAVQAYVMEDARFAEFFARVKEMVTFLLPAHQDEGKAHLSIGFGCSGGKHRSVTMTEQLAAALQDEGWRVTKRHRELERQSAQTGEGTGI